MNQRAAFLIRMYLPAGGLWITNSNAVNWNNWMTMLNCTRYAIGSDDESWDILTHLMDLGHKRVSIEGDCG